MKEIEGNIWESNADVICITTNNNIKTNGELVMGKGIALEAKQKDPIVAHYFANHVKLHGNTPCLFLRDILPHFCSIPTKNNWRNKSDINLIIQSIKLMTNIMTNYTFDKISLTRPGCGNGGLDWETEVKPIIEPLLDNKFTVYYL